MTRRFVPAAVAVLLAAALLAAVARQPLLRGYEATLVLAAVGRAIAASDAPTLLSARTPAPARRAVAYTAGGRAYVADLYTPGEPPRAGIVLLHGAHPLGKDEPRLTRFAAVLARARFATLVPDLPVLRGREVRASLARDAADALAYLAARPELTPAGRVGIGAFSLAVGPAILGALEPDVRDRVRFVLGVGGYYDLPRLLVYFTTGAATADAGAGERARGGGPARREPWPELRWAFLLAMLWAVEHEPDRALLHLLASRKLADPDAPVADLAGRLGPGGRAVYRLVANRDPAAAPALFERLPASLRAAVAALDLANKDLTPLAARLILVHGRDDTTIPYTESERLARAVRPGQARLFLLDRFAHIEAVPSGLDLWRMWRAVNALLAERE